jgi:uncharacterized repeat protein (TIGR01451 family)
LLVDKALTLAGPGPELLAVSGDHTSRVFRVDNLFGTGQIAVTLSGLTIRDGQVKDLQDGGGLWNDENLVLTDVAFRGNSAGRNGGGFYNESSSPTMTNVIFSGNAANASGGGIYHSFSDTTLTGVTFSGNRAGSGGGIYNRDSHPTIQNSILWSNRAASVGHQIYNHFSTPAIAYSDVQGSGGSGGGWNAGLGSDLGGNLDADPLFVGAVGNLRLRWGSPAIDAGDNSLVPPGVTTDLDGAPRFAYGTVDMGAYELQPGLYLYKDADVERVTPGQRLTYTLQAANAFTATAMTGGLISDTLPAGLVFAGPITLEPPGAGVVGATPPVLVSDLVLSPAQIVTITLPVTVAPGLAAFTTLTNTAAVTSSQVLTPQLAYHTIVVVGYYYLPIIFKGGEP